MPWQPPTARHDGAADQIDDEEEDSSPAIVRPPADLLQRVRAVLVNADRQAVYKAFDQAAKSSANKTDDARVNATMELLLMQQSGGSAAPSSPIAPPERQQAIPVKAIGADGGSDSDLEMLPSPSKASASKAKGKGRAPPTPVSNKRKAISGKVIVLDDSDEEDDARPPSKKPKLLKTKDTDSMQTTSSNDKGKGKANHQAPIAGPSDLKKQGDSELVHILAIFSDIDPEYAESLLDQPIYRDRPDKLDAIAEYLFNLNGTYRRIAPSNPVKPVAKTSQEATKHKAEDELPELEKQGEKYMSFTTRPVASSAYAKAALDCLCEEFPQVPKPYVRSLLLRHRNFYAPSYFQMMAETNAADSKKRAFKSLSNPRKLTGFVIDRSNVPDFVTERKWVRTKISAEKKIKDAEEAIAKADAEDEANGNTYDCGCCFTPYVFRKLVQCSGGHLFCTECVSGYVKDKIGNRQFELVCMDTDGCSDIFPDIELRRCIDEKSMDLLDRIRQEKFIEEAQLLDRCPFCPYAYCIDNNQERLFTCANEECSKVSCRQCKRLDHLPKTCAEMEQDEKNNNVHKVEEAMTAALVRKCPKCQQVYIKEDGCNKITCSNCRTLSCFICGKQVQGYQHFKNAGVNLPPGAVVDANAQCLLFDNTAERVHREVEAARTAAATEARQLGVDEATINKLALPAPPPRAQPAAHHGAYPMAGNQPGQYAYQQHNHQRHHAQWQIAQAQQAAHQARVQAMQLQLQVEQAAAAARVAARPAVPAGGVRRRPKAAPAARWR